MKIMTFLVAALFAGIAALPAPTPLWACAPAFRAGYGVDITNEEAIIIYDSATQTEHFIRQASFSTDAKDFGFLVPTPTKPTLAEADNSTFQQLNRITAPPIKQSAPPQAGGCGCTTNRVLYETAMPGGAVNVLEEKRVAGYDAAVLEANDVDALYKWLSERQYDVRPELKEWFKPYIANKWIITAFKIAAPETPPTKTNDAEKKMAINVPRQKAKLATAAVRMTFKTDKPFYPYREPQVEHKEGIAPSRLLRVYFVADERYAATMGDSKPWSATTPYSKTLPDHETSMLSSLLKLPSEGQPKTWWLTEFEDRSSPRVGTDEVYFIRNKDQRTIERQAIVLSNDHTSLTWPSYAIIAVAITLVWLWCRRTARQGYRMA